MPRYQNAPIERHDALAPFSRDHYAGLVQAQRLKKSADADDVTRRRALSQFVDAWDHDLAVHFRDEERLLAELLDPADRERLLGEHHRLGDLATAARSLRRERDPDADTLREIGETLEAHIRWEERELFARLQDRLADDRLAELERDTRRIEQSRRRNTCRSRTP